MSDHIRTINMNMDTGNFDIPEGYVFKQFISGMGTDQLGLPFVMVLLGTGDDRTNYKYIAERVHLQEGEIKPPHPNAELIQVFPIAETTGYWAIWEMDEDD